VIRTALLSVLVLALALPVAAGAQGRVPAVTVDGLDAAGLGDGLVVAVDADDDDEDGVADAAEERDIPDGDLRTIAVGGSSAVELRTEGGLRLVRAGRAAGDSARLRPGQTIHLQGVRASERGGDAALVVEGGGATVRVPVTVVGLATLNARNEVVDATRDAVGISRFITNDASLSRQARYDGPSADPDNIRVEIWDPAAEGDEIRAILEAGPAGGAARASRTVTLTRPAAGRPFRSEWLRLVGDEMDQQAPGVGHRLLRVALRDGVRVRYPATAAGVTQGVRVGRPGDETGPRAARRARLRVHILRATPGGMAAVGGDDDGALQIGRNQVAIANEIWLQCHVGFGDPQAAHVAVVDPPPAWLVAVGDRDGLPARGGGEIRLAVEGNAIGPVRTEPGAPPVQTALAIARAIRAAGYRAQVIENPATEFGAGRSADVMVRDSDGEPVAVSADGDAPLSTDARQKVVIGDVDLSDGLREFDNMTATAGTLEERALVRAFADDDPSTLELFVVNHFTSGTRQGEAFIEADGGAITNVVILDRNGIRQEREAWTQSHELGHVLLDQPFHPDNVGPDRPWLLMDADNSLGLVTGPKRISAEECVRARDRSGTGTSPTILGPMDARPDPPTPAQPFDPGYPRP